MFGLAVTDQARVPAGEHDRRSCIGVLAVFARERQGEFLPGLTEPGAAQVEKKVGSTSGAFEFGGHRERRTADGEGEDDGVESFLFDVEAGAEAQGEFTP